MDGIGSTEDRLLPHRESKQRLGESEVLSQFQAVEEARTKSF